MIASAMPNGTKVTAWRIPLSFGIWTSVSSVLCSLKVTQKVLRKCIKIYCRGSMCGKSEASETDETILKWDCFVGVFHSQHSNGSLSKW